MTTRAEVVAEARSWKDTPYIHQHRAKGHGVDCAGLIIGVGRELGLFAPDFDVNGYERRPDGHSLMASCDALMARVSLADMQPGDVLVIRWERDPQHMGILGDYPHGGLSMIHALGTLDGKGRVIEQRLADRMLANAIQAFAMPGVT